MCCVFLQAEHLYAYIFLNDDPSYLDAQTNGLRAEWQGDPYPRGQLWMWEPAGGWQKLNPYGNLDDSDLLFKTWMSPEVPEPAAVAISCRW